MPETQCLSHQLDMDSSSSTNSLYRRQGLQGIQMIKVTCHNHHRISMNQGNPVIHKNSSSFTLNHHKLEVKANIFHSHLNHSLLHQVAIISSHLQNRVDMRLIRHPKKVIIILGHQFLRHHKKCMVPILHALHRKSRKSNNNSFLNHHQDHHLQQISMVVSGHAHLQVLQLISMVASCHAHLQEVHQQISMAASSLNHHQVCHQAVAQWTSQCHLVSKYHLINHTNRCNMSENSHQHKLHGVSNLVHQLVPEMAGKILTPMIIIGVSNSSRMPMRLLIGISSKT